MNLSDKYDYLRKIGSGSFGEVWEIIDKETFVRYAAKEETESSKKRSMLLKEKNIYCDLHENNFGTGIPIVYWLVNTSKKNILIMELLGENLDMIFLKQKKIMSLSQIKDYGFQFIQLIYKLHKCGYIHRDIKPQNFIVGNKNKNEINICDFGLAKKYLDEKNIHIHFRDNKKPVGTARYSSIYVHNGIEPSRRDDLISIIYVLIYFRNGSLPWQNLSKKNKRAIVKKKESVPIEKLCKNCPTLGKALSYCYSLEFSEEPDYGYVSEQILLMK